MLNQAPQNKDTLSSGGEAVCILILGTRWGEGSVSCPLYFNPGEGASGTHKWYNYCIVKACHTMLYKYYVHCKTVHLGLGWLL